MDTLLFLIKNMIPFTIPLTVVALGGMFCERSGVVNIALEGIMIISASASIFFINIMSSSVSGQTLLILSMLVAVVVGILFSLLHAYASITAKANQVISGTALNLFAISFHVFVARMVYSVEGVRFHNELFRIDKVPVLGDIPLIGDIFFTRAYLTTFIGLGILIIASFVLFKTRFGLRLRACGEHPQAADSVGINVYKMRYIGVMISGALAGLGGLMLVIPSYTEFSGDVAGYGFLALAVLIFGQWNPKKIFLAACFFGLMKTLSNSTGLSSIAALNVDPYFFRIMPYVATLAVLTFTSKKSAAPRAAGEPYDQGKR
jgi:ABC-type uncharacterized transport system permease subunit